MRDLRRAVENTVMDEILPALPGFQSPPPGHYLAGVSGGADSVAMLLLLLPGIREGTIRAEAVHVNHGLRGEESDGDERFVQDLCDRLGIPFHGYRADLRGRRDEASAREARFSCFRQCLRETGAEGLLLAHNADDQAETFLMRLLRGAGPEGLSCMGEEETVDGIRILRPMLKIRREEIREALRAGGCRWREDSSNRETAYLRNRIRMDVMPALEEISPGAAERIRRAAELIREDEETLGLQATDILKACAGENLIDAEKIRDLPDALLSRTLRRWWKENGPRMREHTLSAGQSAALMELARGGKGKINLPGGYHAVRGKRYLHLTGQARGETAPVPAEGKEIRFGGILLRESPSEGTPGNGKTTQEVPCGFTAGCEIRTRRAGDRIRPFGSTGSRKLQDYLVDRGVDEPFRDQIPLLCRGNEVLLVCGIGAGNIPGWDPESRPVRLTWIGKMPWSN